MRSLIEVIHMKKTIQCYADEATLDKVRTLAARERRTISNMLRHLIVAEYERQCPTADEPKKPNLIGD
jgi:hypothetical protein